MDQSVTNLASICAPSVDRSSLYGTGLFNYATSGRDGMPQRAASCGVERQGQCMRGVTRVERRDGVLC